MNEAEEALENALGTRLRRTSGDRLSRLLMSAFPCTVGRLDWQRARSVELRPAPKERAHGANLGTGGFETSKYVDDVILFLTSCFVQHDIVDNWVAFVGDDMSVEYEVERAALPDLLRAVADIPDHKYIFALDASWCFMWSLEDDLYFGLRPWGPDRSG